MQIFQNPNQIFMFLRCKLVFLSFLWFPDLVDVVFDRFYHQMCPVNPTRPRRSDLKDSLMARQCWYLFRTQPTNCWRGKPLKTKYFESMRFYLQNAPKIIQIGSGSSKPQRYSRLLFSLQKKWNAIDVRGFKKARKPRTIAGLGTDVSKIVFERK